MAQTQKHAIVHARAAGLEPGADWLSAPLRHALTAHGLYCAIGDEPSPDVLRRLLESDRKSIANPSFSRARSEERSSLCLGVGKASRITRGKPDSARPTSRPSRPTMLAQDEGAP
jgi:hypothetical protein